MINHGVVESNTKPDAIKLDEFSVWEATNIEEIKADGETLYKYELTQYPKDEYILMKLTENQSASDLAIADLAEFVLEVV